MSEEKFSDKINPEMTLDQFAGKVNEHFGGFIGKEKPVFTAEDFKSLEVSTHGAEKCARIANAKLAPIVEENERLRQGYLADENGNEYVAVCMLKEKICEQEKEIERLRAALEKVKTQDRLRGYPTGAEWIELVNSLIGLLLEEKRK